MAKKSNDKTLDIINNLFDDGLDPSRQILEREWYRNILYYMGEQYLEWIGSLSTFRRKYPNRQVPTPVSDSIKEFVRAKKALILNKSYSIRVWPNSEEIHDREAALLGEQILNHLDIANDEEIKDEKERVAIWMILAGTGFIRTFFAKENGEWGMDAKGDIVKEGSVYSENILPFNVHVDILGDALTKKRFIGIKSIKPKEWVEDTFKVKIASGEDIDIMDYSKRLMSFVANVSPWKGAGLEIGIDLADTKLEDTCIFKEVEFKPTTAYPDGRYIIMVGQKILLDLDRLPIPVEKGVWYYTLTDFHYNYVPGRFWSDSGVNNLISPQNSINAIDQALEMNRRGLGRPKVLTPTGLKTKRLNEGEISYVALEYDAHTAGGQKPEFQSGIQLGNQVLEERKIHQGVMQDSGGDPKNVLRGNVPSGKASGVLFENLRQTAELSHWPDIQRFYRGFQRVAKKELILVQEYYTELRTLKIIGKGNEISVREFKGSDLRNNTDVRFELDVGLAATKAGQTQIISNLATAGLFGDLTADPDTRSELLEKMGISGFRDKINLHVSRAQKENNEIRRGEIRTVFYTEEITDPKTGQVIKEEPIGDDPLFKYDDHAIHYETHRRCILSNEFTTWKPELQTILLQHTDEHQKVLAGMKQNAMAEQMMMAQMGQKPSKGGEIKAPPIAGLE